MAVYQQGITRDKIYFCPINSQAFKRYKTKDYVALPGVSTTEFNIAALGLQLETPTNKLILVGAQSPNPPRVSRPIRNTADLDATTQDRISTYCSYLLVSALTKPGVWTIVEGGTSVSLRSDSASISAIVEVKNIGNLTYSVVVPMNQVTFTNVANTLGLKHPNTITTQIERERLVFRSNNPKPGKASKYEIKNGKKVLRSSVCSDGIDFTNGWQRVKNSIAL